MVDRKNNLIVDLALVAFSIIIAILLVKTGALNILLTSTQEARFLGSFIAGIFFVSIFTAVPATAVFVEIAQSNSIFPVALFGGIGALIGDLVIFSFVKDRLAEDFYYLFKKKRSERLSSIFRLKLFKWLIPFLGALVIASPLPDELGLMMIGLSKMKTSLFVPISFLLNFLGILIIGYISRAVV